LSEELIMSTALRKKMHQDLQLAGLSGPFHKQRRGWPVPFSTQQRLLENAAMRVLASSACLVE
jgi:hypothetical protein